MSSVEYIDSIFTAPINWVDTAPNTDEIGDFEGRGVRDLTQMHFWEGYRFTQAMIVLAGLGIAGLEVAVCYSIVMAYPKDFVAEFTGSVGGMILFSTIGATFLAVVNLHAYADPGYRTRIREGLENGQIGVLEFIDEHGWESIRNWGLWVPADQEPLCTKELLAEKLYDALMSENTRFFSIDTKDYDTGIKSLSEDIYLPVYPSISMELDKNAFYVALDHDIFSEQQLAGLHAKWSQEFIQGIENNNEYFITAILFQWKEIQKAGLDQLDQLQKYKKVFDWVEHQHQDFTEHYKAYLRTVYQIFSWGSYSALQKLQKNAPQGVEEVELSQEVVDTLPDFSQQSWMMTAYSRYTEKSTLLNDWWKEYMSQLDENYRNEFQK